MSGVLKVSSSLKMTSQMDDSKLKEKTIDNPIMKYISLIGLTLQNAISALSMRHGRIRVEKKDLFYSSTGMYCKISHLHSH